LGHILGGHVDEIGMVQAKKLMKLNHLVTTPKVKKEVQDI
jgi:riboflavin synthase alpha subunit